MKWLKNQRFGLPTRIAAVVVLAIGAFGSADEAQAGTGSVFDAPSQRLGQEEAAPSWLSGFVAPMVW